MAFGCNSYVKNLPYANATYRYNFKPGESGKLVLEFWITRSIMPAAKVRSALLNPN